MGLADTGINTAEALDDSEIIIDTDLDPTTAIPNGSKIKVGTDAEEMTVTGSDAGGETIGVVTTTAQNRSIGGSTWVDLANPCSTDGIYTSITLNITTALVAVIVGVFYFIPSATYKCRSSYSVGNLSVGIQTIAISLTAQVGDFIGIYCTTGSLCRGSGTAERYTSGEHIDVGDEAIYNSNAGEDLYMIATILPTLTVTRGASPTTHLTGLDIYLSTASRGWMSK